MIPGLGRSPGGGHGNPLVFLPGESPWTKEPGRLQSMGSQQDTSERLSTHGCSSEFRAGSSSFLALYTIWGNHTHSYDFITTYLLISKSVSLVQAFFLPYLYTICASIYWLVSMCTSRDLKFNKLNIEFIIFLPNQVSSQGIISPSFQTPKPNARISLPPSPKSNYEVLCLQNQYIL